MFAGCNSVQQLANVSDIPAQYVHPSAKQCNYTPDLSNVNAAKLQGYTYDQIVANAGVGYVIRCGSLTESTSSNSSFEEVSITFSGFSSAPSIAVTATYTVIIDTRREWTGCIVGYSDISISGATITLWPHPGFGSFKYADIQISWIAVGN